jgi:hypothetical protein
LISFGLNLWRCWGRVDRVTACEKLQEELQGLNAKARELEVPIAANLAELLEVR